MSKPGGVEGESELWNSIGFVAPLLLAIMHGVIIEAVNQYNQIAYSLLIVIFGLFWPIFIVGVAVTTKKGSTSELRGSARCALASSVIAAFAFYAYIPTTFVVY